MFDRLLALYRSGRLDDAGLAAAVARGWISREEADTILAGEEP